MASTASLATRKSKVPASFHITESEQPHFVAICVAVGFKESSYLPINRVLSFLSTWTSPRLDRDVLDDLVDILGLKENEDLDAMEFSLVLRFAGHMQDLLRSGVARVSPELWWTVAGARVRFEGVIGVEEPEDTAFDSAPSLGNYSTFYPEASSTTYRARQAAEDNESIANDPFAGISFVSHAYSSARTTAMGEALFAHRIMMQVNHNATGGRRWDPVLGEVEDEGYI